MGPIGSDLKIDLEEDEEFSLRFKFSVWIACEMAGYLTSSSLGSTRGVEGKTGCPSASPSLDSESLSIFRQ